MNLKSAFERCCFQSSLTANKGEVSTQEIYTAKLSFISLLSQETPIEESFCSNLDGSKQILREAGRAKVEIIVIIVEIVEIHNNKDHHNELFTQ